MILARAAALPPASTSSTGTEATLAPLRNRSRSAADPENSRIRQMRMSSIISACRQHMPTGTDMGDAYHKLHR
jgi:hypothetical protein